MLMNNKNDLERLEPYLIRRIGRVYFYKHYHQGVLYGLEERCIETIEALVDAMISVLIFAYRIIRVPLVLVPVIKIQKD